MIAPAPVVDTDLSGGVMTIRLNDEPRRNSLTVQLLTELVAACEAAESDPGVRVIVLTNAGNTFCAGANLSERSAGDGPPPEKVPSLPELFMRFGQSPKPYVGKINGHAVAGGMGLAAAMDISIARDDAKFGFTEVRIGVAPAIISVVCLPKMNRADATAAFLRGHRFPATEAARMGLINAAVPADELDAAVDAVIDDLVAGSPNALAASKQLLARVPTMPVDEAFAWTGRLSASLFQSEEAQEGMRAFLEKRTAPWVPAAKDR